MQISDWIFKRYELGTTFCSYLIEAASDSDEGVDIGEEDADKDGDDGEVVPDESDDIEDWEDI